MGKHSQWARLALGSAALSLGLAACDSVLDIQDPKMRVNAAGEGGEPNSVASGGGSSGGSDSGGSDSGGSNTLAGGAGEGGGAPRPLAAAGADGEGGAIAEKECGADAVQCSAKTPQICDKTGHWVTNTDEADGDCAVACAAGKCAECVEDDKRCSVCPDDDLECDTNLPQTCVDGLWTDDKKACAQYCDAGVCKTASSCDAINADRTTCQASESCCHSILVPGGAFKRDYDGGPDYGDASFPAEISPFFLDKFEVTVGRMRQFVSAYPELNLKDGAGKSEHIADDPGWDTAYSLPANKAALIDQLKCAGGSWSDDDNANNDLPLNCASFSVAYAFCIWDGGRLPTEAEWNFAAAGGAEQRPFPWKPLASGPAITPDYANYGDANPGPLAVGSKPLGDGRWGHSDLAGNLAERTLDFHGDYPAVCHDCLGATPVTERTWRGGSDAHVEDFLFVSYRGGITPAESASPWGFRCARDLK